MGHQEETWESLKEFAGVDVDLASMVLFFLPLLSHSFSYITQTGYVWTMCLGHYE